MTIRRAPRAAEPFLRVRNDVVRDSRLSFRARGVLVMMLSYPDDWRFDRDWLAAQSSGEGRDAVRSALQELERVGYLIRTKIRLPSGRYGWDHILFDTPQSEAFPQVAPVAGKPSVAEPSVVNPTSYEDCVRTTENEKIKISLSPPELPDADPRESSTSSDSKPQGGSAYVALAAEGVTGDEADRFIAWADERKGGDKGGGWYRTVASNGDLAGFVKKFRAEYRERCADHQSYYVESCPHHQCPEHLGTTQVGNCHECDYDYGNPAFWDGRSLLCPEHPNSYIYECRDCLQAHRDTGHHISRHRIDRQRTDWKPTPTFTAAAARSPRPSRKTHSDDDPWNN